MLTMDFAIGKDKTGYNPSVQALILLICFIFLRTVHVCHLREACATKRMCTQLTFVTASAGICHKQVMTANEHC